MKILFLFGVVLLLVLLLFFILKILLASLYDALTLFIYKGAPYVDTSKEKLDTMLKLAGIKKSDRVVDLGSGDGRVVFAAAKHANEAVGYEVNPVVYKKSLRNMNNYPQYADKVTFFKKDFMKEDLARFSVIFVYGIGYLMRDLEKKLDKELKKGTKVISNYYKFPNWKEEKEINGIRLYLKK